MFGIDDALIVPGLIGGASSLLTSGMNMLFQGGQNAITREREDSAIQRRVRDMGLAGLNPVLAAGSPASSQALSLPHMEDPAVAARAAMVQKANIDQTMADAQRAKAVARQEGVKADAMEDLQKGRLGGWKGGTPSLAGLMTGEAASMNPYGVKEAAEILEKVQRARLSGEEVTGKEFGNISAEAKATIDELNRQLFEQLGGSTSGNAVLNLIAQMFRALVLRFH